MICCIFGNLSVFSCRYPAPVASICLRFSPFVLPNPGDGKSSLRLLRHPPAHRGRMLRMGNVGQPPDWPNVWCRITSIHITFKWHFRAKILTIAKKYVFWFLGNSTRRIFRWTPFFFRACSSDFHIIQMRSLRCLFDLPWHPSPSPLPWLSLLLLRAASFWTPELEPLGLFKLSSPFFLQDGRWASPYQRVV